jgi:hypothetical protein
MVPSWVAILCSLAVALSRTRPAESASAASLLPYGTEAGDSLLEHATGSVSLTDSFTFLGETFSSVRVNSAGALEWGTASGTEEKLIAPYFGDADMSAGGSVYYRSTTDPTLIQQVSNIVTDNFSGTLGLSLGSLFIVTWHQVPANGQPPNQHNTFQCVLAYSVQSGAQTPVSYVLFLYKDGAMQWSRGAGEGSEPALVGIKNGESRQLILPTSRTESVLKVAETGNTGVAGRWLFRVDGTSVTLPGKTSQETGRREC